MSANGTGVRVSLFVSGCRHHCKGCFNSETWDFNYGNPYTKEVEAEILEALKPAYIQGFSLLGGEPFEPENQKELAERMGSTVRNANRIIQNLENGGVAKLAYTQTTNAKGRPVKVYELYFNF